MSRSQTVRVLRTLAICIIGVALGRADTITTADGPITVTSVVTPIGSLFQYDYTVADGTGLLAVLDIAVSPGISITGFAVPDNPNAFSTAYDSVLGLASFLENNSVFSALPEPGFIFYSPVAPAASTFGVTLFDGTTASGSILGPVETPEPVSLVPCTLGVALLFWRKRWPASRPQ